MVNYKGKEIPKELLNQIFNLRVKINQVFFEKGPANNEFITLTHELEALLKRFEVIDLNDLYGNGYIKNNEPAAYELVQKIEILRDELIRIGLKKGLSHVSTIHISEQLDTYIAQYQNLKNT